ncbi:LCP family protein [Alkalicoccus halolimnae]|uniref:LCP family protein n=1 Tax=Alkalicoccus halolimnae TaxID=1667239 RepID=A0A5C7FI46_9BACI|nr:LCP family protein [Alkalicoccus halolimnae]TXF86987.1 LytR family transcriptional regulator [Alkalicoccus halolimnae]
MNRSDYQRQKKRQRRISFKKLIYITGGIFTVMLLAAGAYAVYLYQSVEETVNSDMQVQLARDKPETRSAEVDMDNSEPVSFLLLGVDEEGEVAGRTDTIIVVTVNPADESIRMLSLPRDLRIDIPGQDDMEKINHVHAYAGPDGAIESVEDFLDIPIDYFITANMNGFQGMIDALGGITVENSFAFDQNEFTFEEGEVELNGEEALAYARMRDEDPRGDIGRNARQRQIVNQIINEGASFRSVTRVEEILEVLSENIQTNMEFDKMRKLQQNYASARHEQQTLEIVGEGETIDDVWYLVVSDEERERVSQEFRSHLNLDEEPDLASRDDEES